MYWIVHANFVVNPSFSGTSNILVIDVRQSAQMYCLDYLQLHQALAFLLPIINIC